MFTPVLELEGTWDEIAPQLPDFNGHRLRISVEVEDASKADATEKIAPHPKPMTDEEAKRRLEKFQGIIARLKQRDEAKPDPVDWLRIGRSGDMYPHASDE